MRENVPGNWASYLPALAACVSSTNGPVIELGVGHFSTPILHAMCWSQRPLVSIEQDPKWAEPFRHFSNSWHSIIVGEYDDVLSAYPFQHWSVALIDESPGGERRAKSFKALLPVCDFVIVHDYWRENLEAISPLLGDARHAILSDYEPPTLVASLTRGIPEGLRKPAT